MKTTSLGIVACVLAAPLAAAAADGPEFEQLHRQFVELKQKHEEQTLVLRALEAKQRNLEAQLRQLLTAARQPAATAKVEAAAPQPRPLPPPRVTTAADQPGSAEKIAESAAADKDRPSRSVDAVLQQEHVSFERPLTFEAGLSYSRADRTQLTLSGFLALDAIFLGNISVDHVKADTLTFDLTGRYNITDRLQVDVNVPFVYRNTVFQKGGAGGAAAALTEAEVSNGPRVGDVSLGVFYRLLRETSNWPDIVWNMRVKAPTGRHPFGIKTVTVNELTLPSELPSGNGVWGLSTGLSFVKTADPAILFANLGYFRNFRRKFDDISPAPTVTSPGEVDLGDSFQFGVGIGFALNERTSLSLSYSQRFTEASRTRREGASWEKIVGSDASAASLNFGVTYALNDRLSMIGSISAGLTADAPDVQVGVKFPYSF